MINDQTVYQNTNNWLSTNADIKTTNNFDYNSFYRAVVMSVEDNEHLGRIKIKIPALHSNTTNYPYAYPAINVGFGYQVGQFILPPVGSIVFVAFEYGDEHRLIYFGGVPTKYAEGKTQSYGTKINNGIPILVGGDDIPEEYTGTQQIIYKAPTGAIMMIDSSDYKRQVKIGNVRNQALIMSSYVNEATDYSIEDEIKFQYNEDTYLSFDENGFHVFVNGVELDLSGGSGTNNYTELINKPSINNVTLVGNKSAEALGLQSILTFDNTPTDNSSNPVTSSGIYNALQNISFDTLTAREIDTIYDDIQI